MQSGSDVNSSSNTPSSSRPSSPISVRNSTQGASLRSPVQNAQSTTWTEPSNYLEPERQKFYEDLISKTKYVGQSQRKSSRLLDLIFNPDDPRMKEDMFKIISAYLWEEGFLSSVMTLEDEMAMRMNDLHSKINQVKKLKKLILDGEWTEVEKMLSKDRFKNDKLFVYCVYKQIYLELIEKQEYQKAFTYLTKRLKPLETRENNPEEFKDLCYILTCKSVQDSLSFKNWDGAKGSSRGLLIEKFPHIFDVEQPQRNDNEAVRGERLTELIRQAVSHQIESSSYRPTNPPKITTIRDDYRSFVLPNAILKSFEGHTSSVKCVGFLEGTQTRLVSGSSDSTLKIWNLQGECLSTLKGHTGRIWDLSCDKSGRLIASASGDSSVKLWSVKEGEEIECIRTLTGSQGDVYSVHFHPDQNNVVTGGFDKTLRLYDVHTGTLKKTFSGHLSAISKAVCSPLGNIIVTGSKDGTIKFWDVISGVSLKTISSHLGEVTSVQINASGTLLLSSSKDNSNRLWDLRTGKSIKRFVGHQNTSKNFLGCGFGPNELTIVGGSEEGVIHIWDMSSTKLIQKLKGHQGIVYHAVWNQHQSVLASCSADNTVKTWWYDESSPLFYHPIKKG